MPNIFMKGCFLGILFFINSNLFFYLQAKTIVQPEAYKELKKKMVQNKIEQERNAKQIIVKVRNLWIKIRFNF